MPRVGAFLLAPFSALGALSWAASARAAGIDSDSQAERAFADDEPKRDSLQERWFRATPQKTEAEAEVPVLTETELRKLFPDLQVQTRQSLPFKLFFGVIAPFQFYAVGIGSDTYVLPWLRLNALVSLGAMLAHPYRKEWEANFYGEAGIGIAALRWQSSTTITWPVPRLEGKPSGKELHALVPSAHAVEIEGGVMTGHAALFRCTADCAPEAGSQSTYAKAAAQISMPYAGLRYVYFRRAWSAKASIAVAQRFQLAAQLVLRPFVQPARELVNLSTDTISRQALGFRVLSQLPLFGCAAWGGCAGLDVGAGLLPSPRDLFLTVSVTAVWAEAR